MGKDSPLSEASKSELFNGLIGRDIDNAARPIGENLVWAGAGEFGGALVGKAAGWAAKGFSKLFGKSASAGTNFVYNGLDGSGIVRYVGITERDPAIRFAEHLNSGTARAALRYQLVPGAANLTRTQARVWEQTLINTYGLGKNGGFLLNKTNSISPKYWGQYGIK